MRQRWTGNLTMAAQITLCFVLLVAAGLLLRSLRNFEKTDLGMKTQGLLVFGVTPQKNSDKAQNLLFYRNLLDRLRSLPGVESATVMENRLGSGWSNNLCSHGGWREAYLRGSSAAGQLRGSGCLPCVGRPSGSW